MTNFSSHSVETWLVPFWLCIHQIEICFLFSSENMDWFTHLSAQRVFKSFYEWHFHVWRQTIVVFFLMLEDERAFFSWFWFWIVTCKMLFWPGVKVVAALSNVLVVAVVLLTGVEDTRLATISHSSRLVTPHTVISATTVRCHIPQASFSACLSTFLP